MLTISHVLKSVVEDIVKKIEEHYGKMTITRGDKHNYIGMDIEFMGKGEVQILMKDYIVEALEMFPEDCTGHVTTPAANLLFTVDPTATRLSEERRTLLEDTPTFLLHTSNPETEQDWVTCTT
jgi:hypothetical protein